MPDLTSLFRIVFATTAGLGGINELRTSVNAFASGAQEKMKRLNETIEAAKPLLERVAELFAGRELLEYANEAEKANVITAKWNDSIARTGDAQGKLREALEKQIETLKEKIGADDDDTKAVQSKLLSYGATKETIQDLTRLTYDYAEFMGTDAVSASDALGRAIVGDDVAMRGFKLQIDTTKPKAEQLRDMIAQLDGHLGGTAAAANEATGGMRSFRVEVEDAQKAIGQVVLQVRNPFLMGFLAQLKEIAAYLAQFSGDTRATSMVIEDLSGKAGRATGILAALIVPVLAGRAAWNLGAAAVRIFIGVLAFLRVTAAITFLAALVEAMGAAVTAFAMGTAGATAFAATLGLLGVTMAAAAAAVGSFKLGGMIAELQIGGTAIKDWLALAVFKIEPAFFAAQGATERAWIQIVYAIIKGTVAGEMAIMNFCDETMIKLEEWAVNVAGKMNAIPGVNISTDGIQADLAQRYYDRGHRSATNPVQAKVEAERQQELDASTALQKQRTDDAKATADRMWEDVQKPLVAPPAAPERPAAPAVAADSPAKAAGGTKDTSSQDLTREATLMLSNAERQYQIQIERTQLLQQSGAISQKEADEQSASAIRAYITSLQDVQRRLPDIITKLRAMGKEDDAKKVALQFQEVSNKILAAKQKLADQGFFGQVRAQLRALSQEWGNLGQQVGQFFTNTLNTGINAAAQGLTSLITRTGNWRQSFAQAASGIIQDLIRIVLQYTIGRAAIWAINQIMGNSEAGAVNAQATSAATAWAPAATSASIASYGVAAGAGLAAYVAALAAGSAAAAGASAATGAAGFASGGYTGDAPTHQVAGVVHGREFVISAPAVKHYGRNFLENINARQAAPMPITKSSGGAISARGGGGSGGSAKVIVVDDGRQAKRLLATKEFRGATVQTINKNRRAAGLRG